MTGQARGSLLIVAVSGRALARAAVDAGYTPLVADFFADVDTQALAAQTRKVPGVISEGFQWPALEPVLKSLITNASSPPLGVVYGSGFEDRPELLERMAEFSPVLGNDAATVSLVNEPDRFFPKLKRLSIPHPATQLTQPCEPEGWIAKRVGGAGGSHVIPAQNKAANAGVFFQRRIKGHALSALFVANRKTATVLGFSAQWTAPADGKPFRYGGAVQPVSLSENLRARLTEIVCRLAASFELTGLNSADFLVRGDEPSLIEVNPRPGATLDLFANVVPPLLQIHLDATLKGTLPARITANNEAVASAIVFAPRTLTIPDRMNWPAWAADLPRPGERIDKQRPICTVLARAESSDAARQLVRRRIGTLLTVLTAAELDPHAE